MGRGRVTLLSGLLLCAQSAPSAQGRLFSETQAERGKTAYQARCAVCHHQELTGDIESPALTGLRFERDWVGKTVGERFQRIRKTMPPEQPGSLDAQTTIDILAFVFEFNEYPVGRHELLPDPVALEKIVIAPPR